MVHGPKPLAVGQNHAFLMRRNGIVYFSGRMPSDLKTLFNKELVTIPLRTRSQAIAEKFSEAQFDRLEACSVSYKKLRLLLVAS